LKKLLLLLLLLLLLQLEKFIDGKWQVVAPADRLKITQLDGQVGTPFCSMLALPL
jgi:hypothetical protein